MVMDASTVQRVAASCVRQGYKPIFTEVAASSKTEHAADQNLSGGLIATLGLFVWTDGSTPATAEFQDAIKKYLRAGQVVSLESTTYPGTTEEELLPRVQEGGLEVGSNIALTEHEST